MFAAIEVVFKFPSIKAMLLYEIRAKSYNK